MSILKDAAWLRWSLATVLATATGACAQYPAMAPAGAPIVAAQQATLTLRLPDGKAPVRRLLQASGALNVRVTIIPETGDPYERQLTIGEDAQTVSLTQVPSGTWCHVKLEVLDADGETSSEWNAVATLTAGANTVPLNPWAEKTFDVASALLELDAATGSNMIGALTPAELLAAVQRYGRAAGGYVALLKAELITEAIQEAGSLPESIPGAVAKAGRLVIHRTSWPQGLATTVTVGDSFSAPTTSTEDGAIVIEPVAPGEWEVLVETTAGDLAPFAVAIGEGESASVEVYFGQATEPGTPLPFGVAGGHLGVGTDEQLYMWGGLTKLGEANPGVLVLGGDGWTEAETLTAPWSGLTAGAALDGVFYTFGGGLVGGAPGAWKFTPGGAIEPIAAPDGERSPVGASAAAIGSKIYLCGGSWLDAEGDRLRKDDIFAYTPATDGEPASNTWAPVGLADQVSNVRNADKATAVVGGRWYMFGGALDHLVSDEAWRFTPGQAQLEALAAMPTPRAGAATVVTDDGAIWVIGGYGAGRRPSAAVEVYHPERDEWEIRAPLAVARAYPTAILVDGLIAVSGGLLGNDPTAHKIDDSVELISISEDQP